jgi:hypothetical protein
LAVYWSTDTSSSGGEVAYEPLPTTVVEGGVRAEIDSLGRGFVGTIETGEAPDATTDATPSPDTPVYPDTSPDTSPDISPDTSTDTSSTAIEGWISVSAGRKHACGVTQAGRVECWGKGGPTTNNEPTGTFEELVSTDLWACALADGGEVQCWGSDSTDAPDETFTSLNAAGDGVCGVTDQGGIECWPEANFPTPPKGSDFKAVAVGSARLAVDTSGEVVFWGDRGIGKNYVPEGKSYVDADASEITGCAITKSGSAYCWLTTRGALPAPSRSFTDIASPKGLGANCGITETGTLRCFGRQDPDVQIPPEGTYVDVAGGGAFFCAIDDEAQMICWGGGSWGEIVPPAAAHDPWDAEGEHVEFTANTSVKDFEVIGSKTCVLTEKGKVSCWLKRKSYRTPMHESFKDLAIFDDAPYQGCALLENGTLDCWWDEQRDYPPSTTFEKALGNGCAVRASDDKVECFATNAAEYVPEKAFVEVTFGSLHGCGRLSDGRAECWANAGDPSAMYPGPEPADTKYRDIAAGGPATCGVLEDGSVECWTGGPFADGDSPFASIPDGPFKQVELPDTDRRVGFACGLKEDGSVSCWGPSSSNVQAPSGSFKRIDAGYTHVCGRKMDDTLECWGNQKYIPF